MTTAAPNALRLLGIVALLVVGGVHFQQYVSFMSDVPTIGVLFVLNASWAAAIAVALLLHGARMRALTAVAGILLAAGSLVAVVLAQTGGIFGYEETSYRAGVVIAIATELFAVVVLGAYLATLIRSMRRG